MQGLPQAARGRAMRAPTRSAPVGYLSKQGHVAVIAGVNVLAKLGIADALKRVDDD